MLKDTEEVHKDSFGTFRAKVEKNEETNYETKTYLGSLADKHDILQSHTAKAAEALQHLVVDILRAGRIGQRGVQQGIDEVATRLVGQNHVGLEDTRGAELADSGGSLTSGSARQVADVKCKYGRKYKQKSVNLEIYG